MSFCFEKVKRVLIVLAAPRSGSSFLFEALTAIDGTYSLHGESTPLVRSFLPTTLPVEDDSLTNEILQSVSGSAEFESLYGLSLGCRRLKNFAEMDEPAQDAFLERLWWRMRWQWPKKSWDRSEIFQLARQVLLETSEWQDFAVAFLSKLLSEEEKTYYDRIGCQANPRPSRDLKFPLLEEPPFVFPPFCQVVPNTLLREGTLVLKSSTNSYRIPWIVGLFPQAQVDVVHLTRNPLASVNGLMDGWLHSGFFSYDVLQQFDQPLHISGYSEKLDGGDRLWNFDLFPGWKNYTDKPLDEVTLAQWRESNCSILNGLKQVTVNRVRQLAFEDLIQFTAADFNGFLADLDLRSLDTQLTELPVVQSTHPPQAQRWKKRRELLSQVFHNSQESQELAQKLGYCKDDWESWL